MDFSPRCPGSFARALVAILVLAMPFAALAVQGQMVSGNGQVAVVGEAFPMPLSLRVLDDEGHPLAGAAVHLEVDACFGIPEAPACPGPDAYPIFENGVGFADLTTDANGVVTSPSLRAGDMPGVFGIFAWLYSAPQGRIAGVYFLVNQATTAVPITPAFSGAWYDPEQSGHGILVEVLPAHRVLAFWFTFTPDGTQQAWFGGVGDIVGNGAIVAADQGQGGRWIPNFDPASYSLAPWGTLTFYFSDCNHGTVQFSSADGTSPWSSGFMSLTRLTQPAGLACP